MTRPDLAAELRALIAADDAIGWPVLNVPRKLIERAATALEAERSRVAALEALALASMRRHKTCEDAWYSCAAATGDDACSDDSRRGQPCDCGADKWNARVAALIELPPAPEPECGA